MNDDYERLQLQTKKKYVLDAVAVGVVPCRLVGVVTRTFAAWDVSALDAVHLDILPALL